MSKINILDKDIYNKIAAGEVVEKPASVVKELVENSIDAGATNITIEILDGGINKIKVMDNGCGIDFDDFDKVFLSHATSKIKTIDDLSSIGTLGFRGEALSSIASVSKVTLSSKTENSTEGYQVKVKGGEMGKITPIGATTGTYIVVEDLFYNIPARKKFLRKPKLEEGDTTNYVLRLILSNPDISFKYIVDNKLIYQSFGKGLFDAIYSVYGKSIVDNISEVNFKSNNMEFYGYIGKPTFSKANRTYQTLAINGRYVINQTISTAIYKAYENFLMKGQFPFFVLHLKVPLDKVDVNVHPNKLEVKFENSNEIFEMVYSNISDALFNINNVKNITFGNEESESVDKTKLSTLPSDFGSKFQENTENSEEIKSVNLDSDLEYESNQREKEQNLFNRMFENSSDNTTFDSYKTHEFKVCQPLLEINNITGKFKETPKISDILGDETKLEDIKPKQSSFLTNDNYKLVGTLFDTYILIELQNKLLIIDQHAGHERLLYDKYCKELDNKTNAVQQLLVPYVIETNYNESIFLNTNKELLKSMGFLVEDFGINTYKVSTTPLLFDNIDMKAFFDDLFSNLDANVILSRTMPLKEYIAKKACKNAVKGHDKLSENEIYELIKRINAPGQVLLCPHGRPIVVEVSKIDIEKWFKRIV